MRNAESERTSHCQSAIAVEEHVASLAHVPVLVHGSPKRYFMHPRKRLLSSLLHQAQCERSNLNRAPLIKWAGPRNPPIVAGRNKAENK